MIGIYKITNKVNGKVYIGQSKSIGNRWYQHIYKLENKSHENVELQYEFNKYGEKEFSFEILELCEQCDLLDNEKKHIRINKDNCYNIFSAERNDKNIIKNGVSKFILTELPKMSIMTQRLLLIAYKFYNDSQNEYIEISLKDFNILTNVKLRTCYNKGNEIRKELENYEVFDYISYEQGVFSLRFKSEYIEDLINIGDICSIAKNINSKYTLTTILLIHIYKGNIEIEDFKKIILCEDKYDKFANLKNKIFNQIIEDYIKINKNISIEYIKKNKKVVSFKINK